MLTLPPTLSEFSASLQVKLGSTSSTPNPESTPIGCLKVEGHFVGLGPVHVVVLFNVLEVCRLLDDKDVADLRLAHALPSCRMSAARPGTLKVRQAQGVPDLAMSPLHP